MSILILIFAIIGVIALGIAIATIVDIATLRYRERSRHE